jgi:hypothetical protein
LKKINQLKNLNFTLNILALYGDAESVHKHLLNNHLHRDIISEILKAPPRYEYENNSKRISMRKPRLNIILNSHPSLIINQLVDDKVNNNTNTPYQQALICAPMPTYELNQTLVPSEDIGRLDIIMFMLAITHGNFPMYHLTPEASSYFTQETYRNIRIQQQANCLGNPYFRYHVFHHVFQKIFYHKFKLN